MLSFEYAVWLAIAQLCCCSKMPARTMWPSTPAQIAAAKKEAEAAKKALKAKQTALQVGPPCAAAAAAAAMLAAFFVCISCLQHSLNSCHAM